MAPTTQKSLYLEKKHGDYVIGDAFPVPKPKAGEVLIKVIAAGLNPADWALRAMGIFIEEYPAMLGLDLAGVVEELGEGVLDLKVGDRVYVYFQWLMDYPANTRCLR
jgi:NADPH:quinone reductase-like Zn-dependent oxidoreductase